MTKLLMCPPATYAGASHAFRQWERLVEILLEIGNVHIELVESRAHVPDIVFTANAALISDRLAVVSNFRYPQRRPEESLYRDRLMALGFATTFVTGACFEGAGDALFDRRLPILYTGYGWRSEYAAAALIAEATGVRTVPLRLVDPRFYHLDMCLCPLGSGHVMAYMPAFSAKAQGLLRMVIGPEFLIELSAEDALAFVCNAIEIGDTLVVHDAAPTLRKRIEALGYRILTTDLSAFQRAGGSAKGLTLKLEDGAARRNHRPLICTG